MILRAKPRLSNGPGTLLIGLIGAVVIGGGVRAESKNDSRPGVPTGTTERLRLQTALLRPFRGKDARRTLIVYLPADYSVPANASRRYPVVYLLHGAPGSQQHFLSKGRFPQRIEQEIHMGTMQPVLLVMPDGNYRGEHHGDSAWVDSADGRDRFETWMVKEIVPYVDAHYRTRPEPTGRFVAGVSEGGLGALNLTLRNPGVFGAAVGLSGYYDMRHFGWGHTILGDDAALMASNSPLAYVPARTTAGAVPPEWKPLKVFLGAGTTEKPYAGDSTQLGQALQAAGVSQVTVETPKGGHNWGLWNTLFLRAMRLFLPGAPPPAASQTAP